MSERHWLLLRHANAESQSSNGRDLDRTLSRHGRVEAEAAAQWLLTQIDGRGVRVICSPAARAIATAHIVAEALGTDVRVESTIYEATPGALMAILNEAGDTGITVLVGHNPGIEQTMALLSEGRTDEYRGMPTASIAWFEVPKGLVEPGTAQLAAFWSP
jgi:phosphohistidine phosphatase